jgi:2-polyprenyl-3-methyl-5-hydroxy-6-metoxy-1,4-benzoquinol methylase
MQIRTINEALEILDQLRAFLIHNAGLSIQSVEEKELDILKSLLESSEWPEAIYSFSICRNESDMTERAENILELIEYPVQGKKILDFGCAEGYVVAVSNQKGADAIGYDIQKQGTLWDKENLTTDYEEVYKKAPYDLILLYDVLDHSDDPNQVIAQIWPLCNANTKIFVRCHPFCSRHGTHLYTEINKAFMHLVFTDEELAGMGLKNQKVNKVIHPINHYEEIFRDKFAVESRNVRRTNVDPFFFRTEIVKKRIVDHWKYSSDPNSRKWPGYQMEQNFIDFWLKAKV